MTVFRPAVPRPRAVRRVEEATGNPFLWVARFSIQGRGVQILDLALGVERNVALKIGSERRPLPRFLHTA